MNTHSEYRRHGYQPPDRPSPQPEAEASELARHHDPSLGARGEAQAIAQKHLAWIRPTELASYAGPMVGRGVDLQADLIRRARRAPATTVRRVRRPGPMTPPTSTERTEGLQL